MREFFDIDSHQFITETELLEEFIEISKANPTEYENVTFGQYINNCLSINNGTLMEVTE